MTSETDEVYGDTDGERQMMEDTQRRTGDRAGHHKGRPMIGDKSTGCLSSFGSLHFLPVCLVLPRSPDVSLCLSSVS